VVGGEPRVLRNIACRLLALPPGERLQTVLDSIELCVSRYAFCPALLASLLERKLRSLDADLAGEVKPGDFSDTAGLRRKLASLLQDYVLRNMGRASKAQLEKAINNLMETLLYSVLLAALDMIGVECPLTTQQQEQQ
jgi:hypothetical protein